MVFLSVFTAEFSTIQALLFEKHLHVGFRGQKLIPKILECFSLLPSIFGYLVLIYRKRDENTAEDVNMKNLYLRTGVRDRCMKARVIRTRLVFSLVKPLNYIHPVNESDFAA